MTFCHETLIAIGLWGGAKKMYISGRYFRDTELRIAPAVQQRHQHHKNNVYTRTISVVKLPVFSIQYC